MCLFDSSAVEVWGIWSCYIYFNLLLCHISAFNLFSQQFHKPLTSRKSVVLVRWLLCHHIESFCICTCCLSFFPALFLSVAIITFCIDMPALWRQGYVFFSPLPIPCITWGQSPCWTYSMHAENVYSLSLWVMNDEFLYRNNHELDSDNRENWRHWDVMMRGGKAEDSGGWLPGTRWPIRMVGLDQESSHGSWNLLALKVQRKWIRTPWGIEVKCWITSKMLLIWKMLLNVFLVSLQVFLNIHFPFQGLCFLIWFQRRNGH